MPNADADLKTDPRGNQYDPDAGATEPMEGRCGAVLRWTWMRYGERRFCTAMPERTFVDDGSRFCRHHKSREHTQMRAKEVMDTGLHTKSIFHFLDKLSPLKTALAFGKFDDLLAESIYDFEIEDTMLVSVDFTDSDAKYLVAEYLDEDDNLNIDVPITTAKRDQATSLLLAAMDAIKMLNIQAKLAEADMEMETTADSEYIFGEDGDGHWVELTEKTEHHLNLPYSRLVRDRTELLQYGGVGIEKPEESDETPSQVIEFYDSPTSTDAIPPEALSEGFEAEIPIE